MRVFGEVVLLMGAVLTMIAGIGALRLASVQINRRTELAMTSDGKLHATAIALDRIERTPDHRSPRGFDRPERLILVPRQSCVPSMLGQK